MKRVNINTSRLDPEGKSMLSNIQGAMSVCKVHALPPTSLDAVASAALGKP